MNTNCQLRKDIFFWTTMNFWNSSSLINSNYTVQRLSKKIREKRQSGRQVKNCVG